MRYYIDCEFDGHGGPLISFAMVPETGDAFYGVTHHNAVEPWVSANVDPILFDIPVKVHTYIGNDIGRAIREYIGDKPNISIVADSPVDIGRFCKLISTDSSGNWQNTGYKSINMQVCNVDCYPTSLAGAIQHNAYWDAAALKHKLMGVL